MNTLRWKDRLSSSFPDGNTGYVVGSNGTILKHATSNGIENLNSSGDFVTVYPNPTVNELNIQNNSTQSVQFSLYNSLGVENIAKTLFNKNSVLEVSAFSSGIYFYKIFNEGNFIATGKLIIQ
jgi:hypothetical protein